jgi:hypothetical protein
MKMKNLHIALNECTKRDYKNAQEVFNDRDIFMQLVVEFLDSPEEHFSYLVTEESRKKFHSAMIEYLRAFGMSNAQKIFLEKVRYMVYEAYEDHIQAALDDYWNEYDACAGEGDYQMARAAMGVQYGA